MVFIYLFTTNFLRSVHQTLNCIGTSSNFHPMAYIKHVLALTGLHDAAMDCAPDILWCPVQEQRGVNVARQHFILPNNASSRLHGYMPVQADGINLSHGPYQSYFTLMNEPIQVVVPHSTLTHLQVQLRLKICASSIGIVHDGDMGVLPL
jgi:hypothetical protein